MTLQELMNICDREQVDRSKIIILLPDRDGLPQTVSDYDVGIMWQGRSTIPYIQLMGDRE